MRAPMINRMLILNLVMGGLLIKVIYAGVQAGRHNEFILGFFLGGVGLVLVAALFYINHYRENFE